MKKIFYIFSLFFFASCGEVINDESIVGCWKVEYIDTDGIKMKSGKYSICINDDGSFVQQREDGKEKVNGEWSLEPADSLLIMHYDERKPDTVRILKADKRDLHLRRKIKYSKVTLYLRKQN